MLARSRSRIWARARGARERIVSRTTPPLALAAFCGMSLTCELCRGCFSLAALLRSQLLAHSEDLFVTGCGNTCEYESTSVQRVCGYSWIGCVRELTWLPGPPHTLRTPLR